MKISLKVEYACRALAQLARSYKEGQLTHIEDLAEAEAIPKNYLVQILSELRSGGLITSRRGKQGGYALVRRPEEISLQEIIQVVNAELFELQVSAQGQSGGRVADVWRQLSETFQTQTAKHTLQSFLPDESQQMYYI